VQYWGIMNQFSLSCTLHSVSKLAVLAAVHSFHFCQVLMTMLKELKQVSRVDTF
jgi:hypothetical protein